MVAISLSAIAFAGDAANVEAAQSVPPIPAQTWRMTEITLSSDRDYAKPLEEVMVTATFTSTGRVTIVRPVFWDGDRSWRVRFAAPSPGVWTMLTASSEPGDAGLHGVRRTLVVSPYPGDLPIYRHGFLKISSTGRYLAHMARPWWRLTPRFGDPAWADFADATRSPMTADDAGTVVVYFYGGGTKTGKLKRLPAVITQRASWYDPRSGACTPIGPVTSAADGTWTIPQRPDAQDWVLLVEPTGSDHAGLWQGSSLAAELHKRVKRGEAHD